MCEKSENDKVSSKTIKYIVLIRSNLNNLYLCTSCHRILQKIKSVCTTQKCWYIISGYDSNNMKLIKLVK